MVKPNFNDYPEPFGRYINQVQEDDIINAFKNQSGLIQPLFTSVSEEKSMYAYAEGKWTLKELVQHVIDTERIFSYRALCISRREAVSMPGFDENEYAANSYANAREWQSLVNEFTNCRKSTEDLFLSFTEEMLWQKGLSNNKKITVLSLGFAIIGHFTHHKNLIEERYL